MKVAIRDAEALRAVSPAALSAWAHNAGWRRTGVYRKYSDICEAPGKPEILLPRTRHLSDYATVVSDIIRIFAVESDRDELALYRDLMTVDRDAIRIRAPEGEDDSLALPAGVGLVRGAQDLLLAAACSLSDRPRPAYRMAANREASALLEGFRLGQTEHGSFTLTLFTPPITPLPDQYSLLPDDEPGEEPGARRVTRRLMEALDAARRAVETLGSNACGTLADSVSEGVSANLCAALAALVEPFPALDIGVYWARTRPMNAPCRTARFSGSDAPGLRSMAEWLRRQEPEPDRTLFGFVRQSPGAQAETDGVVHVKARLDGEDRSVAVMLRQSDYESAIRARKHGAAVMLRGDLERRGGGWRLLNAELLGVLSPDDGQGEA